jgi:hypothetical protein
MIKRDSVVRSDWALAPEIRYTWDVPCDGRMNATIDDLDPCS